MNILCILGFHNWTKWKYISAIGRYEAKLFKKCDRCGEKKVYIGLTDVDIVTGEILPHIMKGLK